jgi:hypothetical protein
MTSPIGILGRRSKSSHALMDPPLRADPRNMTEIAHTAEIEMRAPAEAAFAVVAEDILASPLRVGFRWHETVAHDRSLCRTDWIVTELREPFVLEKTMGHLCLAARRDFMGGERWHFEESGGDLTRVTLRAWRRRAGIRGWLERLFASRDHAAVLSLRKRLADVQFRAERVAPRPS